jgi:hypothetical protein
MKITGSNVTLSGAGTVNMGTSSGGSQSSIVGASPSVTFTNGNTIQGFGTISNMGIVNTGTILANQSAAPMLILPSTAGLTNSGTLSVLTGDTMQVGTAAGGALTNFAGTTLTGGTYTVGGTLQFGASGTSITTDAANISLTGAGAKNSRAKRKGEGLCCPQIHVLPYASSSRAEPHRLCRPDSLLR